MGEFKIGDTVLYEAEGLPTGQKAETVVAATGTTADGAAVLGVMWPADYAKAKEAKEFDPMDMTFILASLAIAND